MASTCLGTGHATQTDLSTPSVDLGMRPAKRLGVAWISQSRRIVCVTQLMSQPKMAVRNALMLVIRS